MGFLCLIGDTLLLDFALKLLYSTVRRIFSKIRIWWVLLPTACLLTRLFLTFALLCVYHQAGNSIETGPGLVPNEGERVRAIRGKYKGRIGYVVNRTAQMVEVVFDRGGWKRLMQSSIAAEVTGAFHDPYQPTIMFQPG